MKVEQVFWWKRRPEGNFGDELTPLILEKIFGVKAEWSDGAGKVLAVGSIIDFAKSGDHVWGSGSGGAAPPTNRLIIHAIRGPLSRHLMTQAGIACPEIYGDPGILLPKIFAASRAQGWIGLVPHHLEVEVVKRRFGDRDGIRVISPLLNPSDFVAELTSCRVILSSSLHGLIAADAYEIPSHFVRFIVRSQSVYASQLKGRFKFDDYYLGVGKEPVAPRLIVHECDIKNVAKISRFIAAAIAPGKLIDSFPSIR